MTITLHLTPDEETSLARKAARAGLTPEQYLRRATLPTRQRNRTNTAATDVRTHENAGARLVAELQAEGLLTGYGDPNIDSPELARQLTARFSKRNREE